MSRCYKTRSKKLRVIKKKGNKSKRKYRVKTRKNRVKTRKNRIKTRKNRVKTRKNIKGGANELALSLGTAAGTLVTLTLLSALFPGPPDDSDEFAEAWERGWNFDEVTKRMEEDTVRGLNEI